MELRAEHEISEIVPIGYSIKRRWHVCKCMPPMYAESENQFLTQFCSVGYPQISLSSVPLRGPNRPLYKAFAPLFTICSTIYNLLHYLQFAPRFYNLLHDLQFAPRFYNLLHDFTIFSTILQFTPRFYSLFHDFTICSTILQFAQRFYNLLIKIIQLGLCEISTKICNSGFGTIDNVQLITTSIASGGPQDFSFTISLHIKSW